MVEQIKGIFHIHTKFSYDSLLDVREILGAAKTRGYDFVVITDHDTIQGSLEAKKYEYEFGVEVVTGAEYKSECGDIIGIFIEDEIKSRDAVEIIAKIKIQDGLVILPHPFKHHYLTNAIVKSTDIIEVFNARIQAHDNLKAEKLAEKYNKRIIAGSDAHLKSELFLTEIAFKKNGEYKSLKDYFIDQNPKLKTEYSNKQNLYKSQMIKGLKQHNLRLLFIVSVRYIMLIFIESIRKNRPRKLW